MLETPPPTTAIAGVDGAPGGWVAMIWAPDGLTLADATRWRDLPLAAAGWIGVDMPIGLSDGPPRACDTAARARLPRGRKASVFPAPRRYMLGLSHAAANAEGRRRDGRGLSVQSWHILAKVAELDAALAPGDQTRVREVHPELVFHHLAEGAPLPPKRRVAGREARLSLLDRAGLPDLRPLLDRRTRGRARPDDVLDAAACALAAARIAAGRARCLPEAPSRDARGLRMEIWF